MSQVNAGALLSTLITPKLRADVSCFGDSECYPLAFGVPAILMFIATAVFMLGSGSYVINIPTRNVIVDTGKVWYAGMKTKVQSMRHGGASFKHWLDAAVTGFGPAFVNDVKALGRVFVMFSPAPIFWTLFDQQGSRWVLQAEQMATVDMVS